MPLFTDFDPEEELISPGFEKLGLALPEYAVMAFLSERPSGICYESCFRFFCEF